MGLRQAAEKAGIVNSSSRFATNATTLELLPTADNCGAEAREPR
jgi:hypothetical protein